MLWCVTSAATENMAGDGPSQLVVRGVEPKQRVSPSAEYFAACAG